MDVLRSTDSGSSFKETSKPNSTIPLRYHTYAQALYCINLENKTFWSNRGVTQSTYSACVYSACTAHCNIYVYIHCIKPRDSCECPGRMLRKLVLVSLRNLPLKSRGGSAWRGRWRGGNGGRFMSCRQLCDFRMARGGLSTKWIAQLQAEIEENKNKSHDNFI